MYELRLIDDEEDSDDSSESEDKNNKEKHFYKPLYDMMALDFNDEIGEFESLAFV
jgi:hypothetical protein